MPPQKAIKSFVIRCSKCKVPFLKIYPDGNQTFLKWYGGKMNETFCRGIYEIECFKCHTKIDVMREVLTTVLGSVK